MGRSQKWPDLRSPISKIRDIRFVGTGDLIIFRKFHNFPWNIVAVARLESYFAVGSLDLTWWPDLTWHWVEIFTKVAEKMGGKVGENPAALRAAVFSLSSKNLRGGGGVQTPPPLAGRGLKECSMQYGSKMPDCKLWHFWQYLFGVRRCPAGANWCKFLRNPVRVKSALKMFSPTPPIFNWKLYCRFIQCDFLLTCANFLPYWCILVKIFYRTGAPCRDQWRLYSLAKPCIHGRKMVSVQQSWCGQNIIWLTSKSKLVWSIMIKGQNVGVTRAKLVWQRPHLPYGILHPCVHTVPILLKLSSAFRNKQTSHF